MKVEVVTIGNDLLLSDVINTIAAHVTRKLREVRVSLTCRVTVGEELSLVIDVLQTAAARADVVVVVGGLTEVMQHVTLRALATLTGHTFSSDGQPFPAAQRLDSKHVNTAGWLVEMDQGTFICLPRNRQELSYLLETHALSWLRANMPPEPVSDWVLLRTVGMMESNLRERLADVQPGPNSRISLDSFAGQTSIRLWAEGENEAEVTAELTRLQELISERLGDYIYGRQADRLEQVTLDLLQRSQIKLVLAECHTGRVLARLLEPTDQANDIVHVIPTYDAEQLADYLQLPTLPSESDLTHWCRQAAERLLARPQAGLGLVVYNHLTPGGIQTLVTLASPLGVSVTQRSFSGRPGNIDQWVCSLALAHLRRWLLVHGNAGK
jgi:nicotinamide-nucleotide amidase